MTCQHSDELLTLGAMQLLTAEEQTRLDAQVRACTVCRERWQEYRALAAAMSRLTRLETAPSRALNGKPTASPNGKAPLPAALFEAGAEAAELGDSNLSSLNPPSASVPTQYHPRQRLIKVLSGLAAAVMLLGLLGGFWLLRLSHAPRLSRNPTATQPTIITYNPCSNDIAKGVEGAPPACGLVVMDYSQTPSLLEEIDPTTGQPLASLKPLPVGNALSAALSADHRTLALGIIPNDIAAPTFIQIVWLDTWELGAKLQMPLKSSESLQDLAITPDGTGIYAVIDDYTQTPTKGTLQYFSYNRGRDALKFVWRAPLPFAPGNAILNDGSFALSADGRTAYLFSAATNPPQLAAVPLKASGIGSPRILALPSVASGAEPPFGDENYTYKPGDPIYQWYQPAVMFVPAQNKLYLVHAEAQNPGKDVLVVIDLAQMKLGPDIPIKGENLPLAAASMPAQASAPAARSKPLIAQPQIGLLPLKGKPYNGRSETGAVSPDGRWIYLSGTSTTPDFDAAGGWKGEEQTNLGLLQINTQTGQVVGRWFSGASYAGMTFGQDARNLYLFGPPSYTNTVDMNNNPVLLVFDTQQRKVVSTFSNIQAGWFILPLP
ncbi:MAG TPA: hypothetical protein VH590_15655 [Ktedonobacterales bacterium]